MLSRICSAQVQVGTTNAEESATSILRPLWNNDLRHIRDTSRFLACLDLGGQRVCRKTERHRLQCTRREMGRPLPAKGGSKPSHRSYDLTAACVNPTAFIAGSVLLGVTLGRFARSSETHKSPKSGPPNVQSQDFGAGPTANQSDRFDAEG